MKGIITIWMSGNAVLIRCEVAESLGLKNSQRVDTATGMNAIAENARYMLDLIQLIKPQPERSN